MGWLVSLVNLRCYQWVLLVGTTIAYNIWSSTTRITTCRYYTASVNCDDDDDDDGYGDVGDRYIE